MEKVLVLGNRNAGALSRTAGESPIEQHAREVGLEAELVYTRHAAELREILRRDVLGKRDKVVVAGGDGTIHAAVQELAGSGVALGILPQGTANNFANALRLPTDLPSALRVIAEGETVDVDLGIAADEYFTEAAGVGIFADVLALSGASHKLPNIVRALWYFFQQVVAGRAMRLTLTLDGKPYETEALSVTVANTFCIGYNVPIAPQARLTDQSFDIVVIEWLTLREILPYYRAIRAQSHNALPKVRSLKAREVRIDSRRKRLVHVDDRAWRYTPVTIRVAPRALRVLVDRL